MYNYLEFKGLKNGTQVTSAKDKLNELLSTPLHIACQNSNIDAVRILIEHHNVDINVLVNE